MGRGEAPGRPTHLESGQGGVRSRQDDGQVECRRREHLRGKARVCKSCSRAHTEWVMSRERQAVSEARANLSDLRSKLASACALLMHRAAAHTRRSGEKATRATCGRMVWGAIMEPSVASACLESTSREPYTSSATPGDLGCGSTASTAAVEGMDSKVAARAVRKVSQSWNFLRRARSQKVKVIGTQLRPATQNRAHMEILFWNQDKEMECSRRGT